MYDIIKWNNTSIQEITIGVIKIKEEKEQKISVKRIFSMIYTLFVYLISAVILFSAILFSFNASPKKTLFGYRYYTVITDSMSPAYNEGDIIFVHVTTSDDINVGDVITFNPAHSGDAYLTHRVTKKYDNYNMTGVTCFKTKGDNNKAEDSFLIEESRVIGKVEFCIPKLGYLIRFIRLKWYYAIGLVISVFIFFKMLNLYFTANKTEESSE